MSARTLAPCGTPAAYARHRYHGERPCEACREAWSAHCAKYRSVNPKPVRKSVKRRGKEPLPWLPTRREAVILEAHRAGALVLGGRS